MGAGRVGRNKIEGVWLVRVGVAGHGVEIGFENIGAASVGGGLSPRGDGKLRITFMVGVIVFEGDLNFV